MGGGELKTAVRLWIIVFVTLNLISPVAAEHRPTPGQWVWADQEESPNTWVAFRTEFNLATVPAEVPTRIAADSKYWLWVNGELVVFEGSLKRGPRPGATWVDEIDLAAHLRPGTNCIAVLGWYWGKDGFSHVDSGKAGLFFEADLGEVSLASGTHWKAIRHPAFLPSVNGPQPNFRLPEHNILFDARLDNIGGWMEIGFDDTAWPAAVAGGEPPAGPWGELVVREIPMFQFSEIRDFVDTTAIPVGDGSSILVARLPHNAQVTPYLEVDAPPGLIIDVRTDNYQVGASSSVRSEYVTREGVQVFESPAWFNGDEVQFSIPTGVQVLRLGYRESGYDTAFAGSFSSSDPLLDELWNKAARTTYVNMRDSFMDCPDRERAQWWGDVVNEMPQAFYAFDPAAHALAKKAIHDLVEWRKNGFVLYSPVPSGNYDKELPAQMLASVGRLGFWQYYLHTGDAGTLAPIVDCVTNYLDLWQEAPNGLVLQRPGDWQWYDWGTNIDGAVIENAWFALALQGAIEMSRTWRMPGATAALEERLDRLEAGFELGFWSGESYRSPGHAGPPDDRANALAVIAGLVPEERYPAIRLVLTIEEHASPFMERFVLEAFFLMGFDDDALRRMTHRFGPMVYDASSTLWEKWDRDSGSDNHGWAGGPLFLLSAHVVGIAPETPGWDRYFVRPRLAQLERASASVVTVRGLISVAHLRSDTEHRIDLQSPLGTTAIVGIPALGMGGGEVYEVSVDGSVIWDPSGHHNLPGITFAGRSAAYFNFEVAPGEWTFVARSTPGLLFSDGFESGDLSCWN